MRIKDIEAGYEMVENTRTFYEECGPKNAQTVILIHTAGCESLEWRHVLPVLGEKGYHAVTIDLPGHGKSLKLEDGLIDSIHGFGEFIWKFSNKKGIKNPVVAGCSIGGDIVLDMGVHHADDLSGIISCEGALETSYPEHLLSMMKHESGMPGWGKYYYYACLHSHGSDADLERIKEHSWIMQHSITEVKYADLTAWDDHDITDEVEKITCPVLYVYGKQDYFLDEEAVDRTGEALPNCRFEKLEGIGHYPMLENDRLLNLMLDFLESEI